MRNYLPTVFTAAFAILLAIFVQSVHADPSDVEAVCHATDSKTETYDFLERPGTALSDHIDGFGSPLPGHEQDFLSIDSDCIRENDAGGKEQSPVNPVPEPVAMLLFGTGLAGLGYASRRYFARDHLESEREDS